MASLSWGSRAEREQLKFELLDIEPKATLIGRFVVVGKLGAGATGVVLEAYDPKLERGVAIKVLRAEVAEESELQARLEREAKALARLSHPNVVSVFEVGQHEQHAFVVMELLRGPTLREWLGQRTRPWREILDVFLAAGRGLAAAHASDLVHRDFKPENLLLTEDGVPKVVDFGLVSLQSATTTPSVAEDRLTEQPVGTRQYMAPEQLHQESVDARADQFSFCVTLHEALTEHIEGSPPPRPILTAIERGRSEDASERWPAMSGLLDALRAGARGERRAPWSRWALVAGVTAGAGALAFSTAEERSEDPCGDPSTLRAIWGPAQGDELRERPSSAHTIERLDAYAERWQQTTEQACRTSVAGEADTRLTCLQHRLVTLDTFVRSLPESGPLPVVALPPPEGCLEPDDSPEPTAAVAETLARARGRFVAGDLEGMKHELSAAQDAARASNDKAGESEVLRELGHLAELEGRYEDAVERYEEGFFLAFHASRDDAIVLNATGALRTEAQYRRKFERAELWAEFAHRLVDEDLGRPESRLALLNAVAALHVFRGRLDQAVELTTSGLAQAEGLPDDDTAIRLYSTRAVAREQKHDFDAATEDLRAALVLAKRTYGETHYATAEIFTNLGSVLRQAGDLDGAAEVLKLALEMYEEHLGPKHADTGLARLNLSAVYYNQGEVERSAALLEGLPALFDEVLGPGHPWTAVALRNICVNGQELDRQRDVIPECRRAVQISTKANGPDHFETAQSIMALATVLHHVGDTDELEELATAALKGYEPDFPLYAADCRLYLAEFFHTMGRDEEALELLDVVTAKAGDDAEWQQVLASVTEMRQTFEGGA